jgi:hypothetical protein
MKMNTVSKIVYIKWKQDFLSLQKNNDTLKYLRIKRTWIHQQNRRNLSTEKSLNLL